MASSRLERVGTIYTRVQGLLRSGALKPEDKPLWYEVYEAFPPKYEPKYGRVSPETPIRQIFYSEDVIRAKYYKTFGSNGLINLRNSKFTNPCQKFVEKYQELQSSYTDEAELIQAAAEGASSSSSISSMFSTVASKPQV